MGVIISTPVNSFRSLSGRYVLTSKLYGHTDAITCVSLSKNGSILASGGKSVDALLEWKADIDCEQDTTASGYGT